MRDLLDRFWRFLGSFGLAAILLVLLAFLTFWGTLEQARSTLYDVQTNYFESIYVVHHVDGKYPLPLPGGYLLMALLFVNLIVGGLIRLKKDKRRVGVFVIHCGIALLLLGGFIEGLLSTKGMMSVSEAGYTAPRNFPNPPQSTDVFVSSQDWEVAVIRVDAGGAKTEFAIPQDQFEDLSGDDTLRATHPDLPFDVVLSGYARNARIERDTAGNAENAVDGLKLVPLAPVSVGMGVVNVPGLEARIVERATGTVHDGLLSGRASNLLRFTLGSQPWSIELQKRSWHLPFEISLDRFVHEYHPGTGMPRRFSSFVDVVETQDAGPTSRRVHITMNEPLRNGPYTLYQTNWGPQDGKAHTHYYSVFEVVKSPSDAWSMWPIWSCAVIALGLLIHFVNKLVLYLRAESRKRAAAGSV